MEPPLHVPPMIAPPLRQPDIRCATYPGDYRGGTIDCSAVCERVCAGLADCPCNDNGRSIGCWVPKSAAKELCSVIKDCLVVSTFAGNPLVALPHYRAWAHLGALPMVASDGFVAAVCDKDVEGCFACKSSPDCSDIVSQSRQQCFATQYDLRKYELQGQFCVAGVQSLVPCARGITDRCCSFVERGTCDVFSGTCVAPGDLCDGSVIKSILELDSSGNCKEWMQTVIGRGHPTLASTCTCLSHIAPYFATSPHQLDCALIPNTRSINQMINACNNFMPCSWEDRCEGCTKYYNRDLHVWLNVTTNCGYWPERHRCVAAGDDGVLLPFSPCSTSFSAVSSAPSADPSDVSSSDWYFITPPAPTDIWAIPVEIPAPNASLSGDFGVDPLPLRLDPVNSTVVAPSPHPFPSPVVWPSPLPVNFAVIEIGSALSHRHFFDGGNVTVQVALTCNSMPDNGTVEEWGIYAARGGRLHVQILRPIAPPESLAANPDPISAFTIVGENVLHVPDMGLHRFPIAPASQIAVQKGDIISFYSLGNGIVAWSEGGGDVLWRYGLPTAPTPSFLAMDGRTFHSTSLIFVGEGVHRTYSVSLKGRFSNYVVPVEPSVTPFPSQSASASRSFSSSRSPSHSPMPSSSPTPTAVCNQGQDYWCKSEERRAHCAISKDLWNKLCTAAPSGSLEPSHVKRVPVSRTPSPTVSPSVICDRLMRCDAGFYPRPIGLGECFVAAVDCLPLPCTGEAQCNEWRNDNVATFPECPYCLAGLDWNGICSKGKMQSPIAISWDVVDVEEKSFMFFEPAYTPTTAKLVNTGSALMMNGDFGTLVVEGIHYDAQSIVLHSPPEHSIEGVSSAAVEVQVLHKRRFVDPPNPVELLMVAVFFDEDVVTNSVEMSKLFFQNLPTATNSTTQPNSVDIPNFDLNGIITNDKPVAWYNGSLTVPPCTEGITWAVMMGQNSKLSASQVAKIDQLFRLNPNFAKGHGNNRLQQPLNDRRLLLRSNCGTTGAIACPRSTLPPGVEAQPDYSDAVLFAD